MQHNAIPHSEQQNKYTEKVHIKRLNIKIKLQHKRQTAQKHKILMMCYVVLCCYIVLGCEYKECKYEYLQNYSDDLWLNFLQYWNISSIIIYEFLLVLFWNIFSKNCIFEMKYMLVCMGRRR